MAKTDLIQKIEIGGETFSVVGVGDLDPDYRRDPKTDHFCCLCQRDIKTARDLTQHLHFVEGGMSILSQADEARYQVLSERQPGGQFAGEMGCFPVGPECARKLPKGFVIPSIAADA